MNLQRKDDQESGAEVDEDGGDEDEVYCICRRPDTGKWMIGCDGCDDWFHGQCVNVAEEDGRLLDKYYCERFFPIIPGNLRRLTNFAASKVLDVEMPDMA